MPARRFFAVCPFERTAHHSPQPGRRPLSPFRSGIPWPEVVVVVPAIRRNRLRVGMPEELFYPPLEGKDQPQVPHHQFPHLPGQIPVDHTRAQCRRVPFVVPGGHGDVPVLDEDVPMSSACRVRVSDAQELGAPRRLASRDVDQDYQLLAKPNHCLHIPPYAVHVGERLGIFRPQRHRLRLIRAPPPVSASVHSLPSILSPGG